MIGKRKAILTVPSIFGPSIKVEQVFKKQVRRDRWLFVWKEGKLWGWMCVNIIGMPTQVQKPCFTEHVGCCQCSKRMVGFSSVDGISLMDKDSWEYKFWLWYQNEPGVKEQFDIKECHSWVALYAEKEMVCDLVRS